MTATANEVETYGAMLVGLWSIEFLDDSFGLFIKIMAAATLTYKFIRMIIKDISGKKKGKNDNNS